MEKDITEDLLRRYLAGECTPEEQERVNAWYHALGNESDVADILDVIHDEGVEERILVNIKSHISSGELERPVRVLPARRTVHWFRYAAVLLILVLAGAAAFYFVASERSRGPADELNLITNSYPAIQRIQLPDGSLIWLYPNSSVEFPEDFGDGERHVSLKGEAFFIVARDEKHPFSIRTSDVVTTVLGTSFNIKAYEHESSIEVEVMSGKVRVGLTDKTGEEVLLTSNQKATYRKGGAKVEMDPQHSETTNVLSIWKPVNLSFENASVGTVLQALNERFKVRIHLTHEAIANCMIRADFNDQNLPDILEMLSKSINATYRYEGNIFHLDGEGCTN
jgi:ferric-dicitrate binding protein FerR (iron transport regulator)